MPNKLILKLRNSKIMTWLREADLGKLLNIFGILTIYRNVLFIIAKSHHKADNSESSFLTVVYQIIGFFLACNWVFPTTKALVFGAITKGLLVFVIWFFLPFVWLEYHNTYSSKENK